MSPTSITFYAPDGSLHRGRTRRTFHLREISYRLSGGNLQRTSVGQLERRTARRGRCPALGSWVTLLGGISSSTIFKYYDGSQPPALTTNPAAVRTVSCVTLTVPGHDAPQFSYSSSATLRETPPS